MSIEPWQINSFLLAMHNIATALGALSFIAFALIIYLLLGGFGSASKK
jgi:hypothetical protein